MKSLLAAITLGLFSLTSFAMHHEGKAEGSQKAEAHEQHKKDKKDKKDKPAKQENQGKSSKADMTGKPEKQN